MSAADNPVLLMSATKATTWVRKLVKHEQDAGRDLTDAMKLVSRQAKVGFWTLSHLRKGNAKSCDSDVLDKIRRAYLELCRRQLAALRLEITLTRKATPDDSFDDLEQAYSDLAARLADARAHSENRRGTGHLRGVDPARTSPLTGTST